ncbi:MAG: DUF6240 domain-containing protein [Clostridiales bacterium]|nr:DUF6240 domain-containing protein [Clostridiales bacterium]
MNMNGIRKVEANVVDDTAIVTQGSALATYEIGQEVEGVISNVSDKISINFSGKEVKVPSTAVKDAKEGETRTFQIMDISKNGIVLKEVGSTKKQENAAIKQGLCRTQVKVNADAILNSNGNSSNQQDGDLDKISNMMSAKDYDDLNEEGVSSESYAMEQLERALERIKTQRSDKSERLEKQIEQLEREVENIREIAKSNISDYQAVQQIVEQLIQADMPVTQDNVLRMVSAIDMLGAVSQMSDSASCYLIKNEMAPTIENVYKAVYSRETVMTWDRKEAFTQLRDSIDAIIENMGDVDKEEALSSAKWLLNTNLPITSDNINYKMALDHLSETLDLNNIMENVIETIKNGKAPETADLLNNPKAMYQKIIQSIDSIQEESIQKAVNIQRKSSFLISIQSLMKIQEQEDQNSVSKNQDAKAELAAITAKRQLEEIRLKLTYEASNKLLAKGFKIETEELSKVVMELKNLEKDYYQNVMKEITSGTTEGAELLQKTQEAVQNIKQSDVSVLGQTFTARHSISLADLNEVATTSQTRYQRAEDSYEALMTAPRSDMGDSIQKAFAHMDSQLELLGLEPSEANRRAVRILGYNNMELSNENIAAMKAYDAKVNELLTNLSPSVTASMIKDHINPLEMSVEELNQVTNQYRSELGEAKEVKYSQFLVELEEDKEITPKEREAYIGIYRLLHQIEASDGAAIGALVKSGKEFTLNNLLTEVRTRKQGKMDISIDDTSEMKTSSGYQNSITDSINSYFNDITDYNKSVIRSINKNISLEGLTELASEPVEELMDIPLEQIKEAVQKKTEIQSSFHTEERLKEIQELSKNSKNYISFLNSYSEPDSIHNIEAAKYSIENSAVLYEQAISKLEEPEKERVKKESEHILNVLDSKEDLQKECESFTDHMMSQLESTIWTANLGSQEVRSIKAICDALKLNSQLAKKEYYNIPISTKDTVVNMNLTVVHNSESRGQLRIQLPLEGIGNITVQALIDQHELKGYITCDQAQGIQVLRAAQETMEAKLRECGLSVTQLNYGIERIQPEHFIFSTGSIYKEAQDTKSEESSVAINELYAVSKAIVEQLTKLA